MSFFEILKAFPEGSDSASRLALAAKRLGYHGIMICNEAPDRLFRPDAAQQIKGVDVILGAEVFASNPRALRSRISSLRSRYPLLVFSGYSEDMARAACEDPNLDLLILRPELRRPLGIVSAKSAGQNQVAIGFDMSPLVQWRGSARSRWIENVRRSLELSRKFDLKMAITMCARSHLDLRSPRDLAALAEVAGFESYETKEALKLPRVLFGRNNRKWLSPGVELL
jgi:ribonuclease P/MRP protein subunit RPP1